MIRHLEKKSDFLFTEQIEGSTQPLNWLREIEPLNIRLNNVIVEEFAKIEFEAIGDYNIAASRSIGNDFDSVHRTQNSEQVGLVINADGVLLNGDIRLIETPNKENVNVRHSHISVSITTISRTAFVERLALRLEDSSKLIYFGTMSFDNKPTVQSERGAVNNIRLNLIVPADAIEAIVRNIRGPELKTIQGVTLIADVAVYRSEVDKGLEDWDTPKSFYIEQDSNPAFFNSLTVTRAYETCNEESVQPGSTNHRDSSYISALQKRHTFASYDVLIYIILIMAIANIMLIFK